MEAKSELKKCKDKFGTRVETCACLGRIGQLEAGPAPE